MRDSVGGQGTVVLDSWRTSEGRARLRREGASRGWWEIVEMGMESAEG